MTETIVIIPTYNEKENIADLVGQVMALPLAGLEAVIVDDNSPDGTGDIADALAEEYSGRVHVVHRPGKLGLGTAYIAGFKAALSRRPQRIMTMDADFSHNPAYIPAMVEASTYFDLVIGSRYVPGGGAENCTLLRILLSKGANFLAKTLLGLYAGDCTAGFRCYRRVVLETIPLDAIFSNGYSFLIEMLFLTQQAGFTVGEVPITFANRTRGASKISRDEIIKAQYTVLRLAAQRFIRDRKQGVGLVIAALLLVILCLAVVWRKLST